MLAKELDDPLDNEVYWTDSSTVLQYISKYESKRFQVFVANRVQTIRASTYPAQWHYVESKINAADDASRGLGAGKEFLMQQRWIKGPSFLWKSEGECTQYPIDVKNLRQDDPEIKKTVVNVMVINERKDILQRLTHFSDWHRLKKIVAWLLRIKPNNHRKSLTNIHVVKLSLDQSHWTN